MKDVSEMGREMLRRLWYLDRGLAKCWDVSQMKKLLGRRKERALAWAMKGKGLGPSRPTLMQKMSGRVSDGSGRHGNVGTSLRSPDWRPNCWDVSEMGREMLGRLWDLDRGLAKCWDVSEMARR